MLKVRSAKSNIARQLILYIVIFSSFITLVTTAIQLYRDYNTDLSLIQSELQQIEGVHLESLDAALWASNQKLLQTSIDGILKIRDMQYVEIRDAEQLWASSGKDIEKNTIRRQYPMTFQHRGKDVNIGNLTVVVSLDGVYQRLVDKVWIILISNAIKTFLVAIFIYFAFYQLVARHLSKISHFAETDGPLLLSTPLTLDRASTKTDEFDVVVDAINDMRDRLHDQIAEIDKQQQYLAQTLDSIGDAVIATDIDGNVSRMNPVAEQVTGWSFEEAEGESLKRVFPIIDASTRLPIENPVDKVIATGETVYLSNHTTLIAKNGEEFQIADSAAPIRESRGGKILGMVLVFNDVTEKYRLREMARKSERRYRTLATVSPVGIFHTDNEGGCLYVNDTWCRIAGLSLEEAQGDGWVAAVHPDDREQMFVEWVKATKEDLPFNCEYRFQRSDGTSCWVFGQAIAEKDEDGAVVGYVGTVTDISVHKESEERLRESSQSLADAQRMSHIGNWELDLVTGVLEWSDEIYRIFEIDPDKFGASYEAFLDVVHPDDREKVSEAYQMSLENKKPYDLKHRLLMPDGRVKHVIEHCVSYFDEAGNPLRSTGTVQDITDQTNAEDLLLRTQKMDALGKLTGGIAHDYNNMLGIILGYVSLLEGDVGDEPKLTTYAEQIRRAAERGVRLTKKILAFSRHKSSDAESIDINRLLKDEVHMLEKTLTARIQLTLNLHEGIWPVFLDSSDLEDAIVNMSINAMHAMGERGELTLRTSNESLGNREAERLQLKPGDYVLLSITDTGCGMDEEMQEKIFDPFYTTKGNRGTGLGLSQVYGFVERSHGVIKVYSEEGHGSSFVLYFPRSDEGVADKRTAAQDARQGGAETLLVVDDEPGILALAEEILSSRGYHVLTAKDGVEALSVLENNHVDLIVTDVIMPNMDGYQLAAQVQKRYPHIKLQIVSGFADNRHNSETDAVLRANMLYKPYASSDLLACVRELLDDTGDAHPQPAQADDTAPTILVMDDDENVLMLFEANLKRLGYNTVVARDGDEAIAQYQRSLDSGAAIDAVIVDLTIPQGMGGKDVAQKLLSMDPGARIIVSSGHSEGPEMTNYQDFGFSAALEKNFDRENIKQVLEQVLA